HPDVVRETPHRHPAPALGDGAPGGGLDDPVAKGGVHPRDPREPRAVTVGPRPIDGPDVGPPTGACPFALGRVGGSGRVWKDRVGPGAPDRRAHRTPEETLVTETSAAPAYRRVLLKLSGEVFGGGTVGVAPDV